MSSKIAPGAKKAGHKLDGVTGGEPQDVTICPDGTALVAGGPRIEVYAKESEAPTRSMRYP